MKALRRAAARFREAGSMPLLGTLVAVLLLAMSAPLAAGGERSRPSDSSDAGRSAVPRSEGSAPSYSPPPSTSNGPGPSSGSGSGSRTAVPRSGGSDDSISRQRPHGSGDHGHGHGSGWYGGGGWYGGYGYHYPSWYYYGPYWGWGWSWWWDDWFWYGGYRPYYYPYYGHYSERYNSAGALDVDVSPGKTEVWIDGRYTGTADNFDGFPQYLWLDDGVYDLVLFRDGYKTIARQVTIRPGTVMSIDDRMQPGESVRPEDIATKTHERRDERVRSEEERREELSQRDRDNMDDWRERAHRRMEERNRYDDEDEDEMEEEAEGRAEATAQDGIGRLHLDVLPADASVYLDGHFVGTGIDVQRVRNGLRLEPGQHRIAVVRPGHKAEEQEFTVAPGQEVDLDIELEAMK